MSDRTGFAPLIKVDDGISHTIAMSMAQNWGVKPDGSVIRFTKSGKVKGSYKDIKPIVDLIQEDGSVKGMSDAGFLQFRAAVKATIGEAIGNMNSDDVGAVDTDFFINQMMAFKSWMPALIQEYFGKLRYDETTQSMRWGRFKAYLNEYRKDLNLTAEQLESGKWFYTYMSKVVAPNIGKLALDIATFGIAPRFGMKRVNETRARIMYDKWRLEHPALKDKISYDDFLEIKEGQIKAMTMQLRFIIGMVGLAMFLGGKGDDGEPRYYENFVTRNLYKMFSKAGSELTFMWNPAEFIRIAKNPLPITGMLTRLKNTVFNGFDESRDIMFGENSKQDKAPRGYYMSQWMYGGPQLTRFFEAFENMKKSQYQVFSTSTR